MVTYWRDINERSCIKILRYKHRLHVSGEREENGKVLDRKERAYSNKTIRLTREIGYSIGKRESGLGVHELTTINRHDVTVNPVIPPVP